jgi:hypothetical protein
MDKSSGIGPLAGIYRIIQTPRPDTAGPSHDLLSNYHYIYNQLRDLEVRAPYPKGDQNFAEIARHFMPLIYLLGTLETLVRVLFPIWLIPLWMGFRRGLERSGYVPAVVGLAFLLTVFASLIHRDYIQSRFLYVPVFCLFPWIGAGLDRLFSKVRSHRDTSQHKTAIKLAAFLAAFLVLPLVYLGLELAEPRVGVTAQAGSWLKARPETHGLKLVTNDLRIPFYAQRGLQFTKFNNVWNDYSKLEAYAHGFGFELIALRMPLSKKQLIPSFKYYREINNFSGSREYAALYATPVWAARIETKLEVSTPAPGTQRTPK